MEGPNCGDHSPNSNKVRMGGVKHRPFFKLVVKTYFFENPLGDIQIFGDFGGKTSLFFAWKTSGKHRKRQRFVRF